MLPVAHLGLENCLRCCICLLASSVASMFFSLKLRHERGGRGEERGRGEKGSEGGERTEAREGREGKRGRGEKGGNRAAQ